MMKKPLIVIGGPTACGKTGFSIRLAKEIGGEVISADSMQIYRYMDGEGDTRRSGWCAALSH